MPLTGLLLRRASKNWTCDGDGSSKHRHAADCTGQIEKGEKYIESLWESPAYHSGSRHSLECAVAFYGWKPL